MGIYAEYHLQEVTATHSLANRHSCLTPAKNEGIDIDGAGPIVEGMINQQTMFVYPWRGHVNRNIVGYNKYVLVVTVVVVFVSYFHSYVTSLENFRVVIDLFKFEF